VEQWRQRRETTWPKHRFYGIVVDALRLLGRVDGPNALAPEAVTERLLNRMQEQLRVIAENCDKEQKLRSWVEKVISSDYPETMPIDTRDLQQLGLPPGPAYREIMKVLQAEYDRSRSSRDTLLEMARQLVLRRS
jgi:hypothetical protein